MNAKKIIFGVVFTLGAALYGDPLGEHVNEGLGYSERLTLLRTNSPNSSAYDIDRGLGYFWLVDIRVLNEYVRCLGEDAGSRCCGGILRSRMQEVWDSLTDGVQHLVDESKGVRKQEAEKTNIEKNIRLTFLMLMWERFSDCRECLAEYEYGELIGNAFKDVLKEKMKDYVLQFGMDEWWFKPGAVQVASPYKGGIELLFVAINEVCQGVAVAELRDPFAGIIKKAMRILKYLDRRTMASKDHVEIFDTKVGEFIEGWKSFCADKLGYGIRERRLTNGEDILGLCEFELHYDMGKLVDDIVEGLPVNEDLKKGITLAFFIKIWQACSSEDVARCATGFRGIVRKAFENVFSQCKIVNGLRVTGGLSNPLFAHLMESDVNSIALRALIFAEARKLVFE